MQTREEKLQKMRDYRATPEYKAKRVEYDKKRLQDPEVVARMKAYRQSERGKAVTKKASQKLRAKPEYKAYARAYKSTQKAKDVRRNGLLKKTFGISLEEYNLMFEQQNGVCAICLEHKESDKRSLAVDHCHKTGRVRGLLCRFCNQALGQLEDDRDRLTRAIKYLENV